MDTNNDGFITIEDIKKFSEKHFLFYDYEVTFILKYTLDF